ncbi:MAG: hypothetical protein V2A73_17170 [Pseudomonadota bacterium]
MIITILWEDQRGVESKGFGPHELLLSCLADDMLLPPGQDQADRFECFRRHLKGVVRSIPQKGNSNVRKALQQNGERLARSGPVFAVVDRDKIRELWKNQESIPMDCMTAIRGRFHQDAPGKYDLVFLEQNVETLLVAALALNGQSLKEKPAPDERDRILVGLARDVPSRRAQLRRDCGSFDRLVTRVAARVPRPSMTVAEKAPTHGGT